jgi:HSP20 family protein
MAHPWKSMFLDLQQQIDEMFEELVYRPWAIAGPKAWQPPLDVLESANAYLVVIDLPGVAPEEVRIHASERTLTISGQRPASLGELAVCQKSERLCGTFQRSVEFRQPVDPEKVHAECRHGIYSIRLPKKLPSQGQPQELNLGTVVQVVIS